MRCIHGNAQLVMGVILLIARPCLYDSILGIFSIAGINEIREGDAPLLDLISYDGLQSFGYAWHALQNFGCRARDL